jgi:hypothetical protein
MDVKLKKKYIYQVETGEILSKSKEIIIKDIFCYLVSANGNTKMLFRGN